MKRKSLGKAIAFVRKQRGFTQKELAKKTKKTINFISLLENGDRFPSYNTLNILSKSLGISVSWFFIFAHHLPKMMEMKSRVPTLNGYNLSQIIFELSKGHSLEDISCDFRIEPEVLKKALQEVSGWFNV